MPAKCVYMYHNNLILVSCLPLHTDSVSSSGLSNAPPGDISMDTIGYT